MVIILRINVKIGDKVRVRQWDEMRRDLRVHIDRESELTENQLRGAKPYTFTEYMKRYCGKVATVTDVNDNGEAELQFDGSEKPEGFIFREWMIERCE